MFTPRIYRPKSAEKVSNFISENDFATVVTTLDGRQIATHIPIEFDEKNNCLNGHISIANEQKKCFEQGSEALVIFMNAHSYISSSWYNHVNVPTWNYVAVHISGKTRLQTEAELYSSLESLVNKYEEGRADRFKMEDLSEMKMKTELKGIVGFEIAIEKIEATYKLSQNRNEEDQQNIISKLEAQGDDFSLWIAREMKNSKS